jgi:ubiquinone/menaquinone biosynthesis C-methylase UbiE
MNLEPGLEIPRRPGWLVVMAAAFLCLPVVGLGESEAERIAELLGVKAGSAVADVGAGDGRFSFDLAARVGTQGQVFATEVDPDKVHSIRREIEERRLENVSVIQGSQLRMGLPPACCNAVLIREVYHHFNHPAAMHRSLLEALRPGALVAIIDFEPGSRGLRKPAGVPDDRGGHGIAMELLISEMTGAGFELVDAKDDWTERLYCALFRRPRND